METSCYAVLTPFKFMADDLKKALISRGLRCPTPIDESIVGFHIYPTLKLVRPCHNYMNESSHEINKRFFIGATRISCARAKTIFKKGDLKCQKKSQ